MKKLRHNLFGRLIKAAGCVAVAGIENQRFTTVSIQVIGHEDPPCVRATELYDYETDPLEPENLADKADRANLVIQHQVLFDQLLPHLPARE